MRRFATIIGLALLAPLLGACAGTDAIDLAQQQSSSGTTEPQEARDDAPPSPANGDGAPAAPQGQPSAAISPDARVQFAPVIGAPAEALQPLSRRLSERARQRNIAIAAQGAGASLVIKGYFSAIADGRETTVIYVWDVLDSAGNRLHRIQGQQKESGGRGDGWSSVTGGTMEAIADRTIDDLAAWLSRGQG